MQHNLSGIKHAAKIMLIKHVTKTARQKPLLGGWVKQSFFVRALVELPMKIVENFQLFKIIIY